MMCSMDLNRLNTEKHHPLAVGLDTQPPQHILSLLLLAQVDATQTLSRCFMQLQTAAELMARTISGGHRLFYAGAGSSGFMAMADALELHGTFGIPFEQVHLLIAGSLSNPPTLTGVSEDELQQAIADSSSHQISVDDCVICVSASGVTPYTMAVFREAGRRGASTIALVNSAESPMLQADVPIHINTPPELIAGSTRLGAATSQKVALNMMSTLMATLLGHVHDGLMVNLHSDNTKLHARACKMVMEIADCEEPRAMQCLEKSGGSVKAAVLLACGVPEMAVAQDLLDRQCGNLRAALDSAERSAPDDVSGQSGSNRPSWESD